MAIKLDDFLSKKKEPAQVLDLSRVNITSKEEFRKYFDKIPEYKIKPEKVLPESIKIRDKDFSFTPNRREGRVTEYNYLDPTPPDMKSVNLADLCPVSIDWKMLTTLRPKTKTEEDMFSRLVQLGKLDLKYQQGLKRAKDSDWIRKTKNPRSSIVETRVLSCKECGEDFCDGSVCCKLMYENFFRIQPSVATGVAKDAGVSGAEDADEVNKKKSRRGRRRTRKVRKRKLRKNSIFNRPASRGCSRDHSRRERAAASVVAWRSASQDRASSAATRKSSSSSKRRARSAPRIHFKEVSPSAASPNRKAGYTSESPGISQSDYSTQSQSDSESPVRRVEFEEGASSSSRQGFVRKCTLSAGEYSDNGHGHYSRQAMTGNWSWRYRGGDTTSDTDDSVSPDRPDRRRPTTIDLSFEPDLTASQQCAHKGPVKGSSSRLLTRRQQVRKLQQGLAKIELALSRDTFFDDSVKVRRRHRSLLSARGKRIASTSTTSGVQGRGLFLKQAFSK